MLTYRPVSKQLAQSYTHTNGRASALLPQPLLVSGWLSLQSHAPLLAVLSVCSVAHPSRLGNTNPRARTQRNASACINKAKAYKRKVPCGSHPYIPVHYLISKLYTLFGVQTTPLDI